ncbi:MAG: PTS transporter subunit IIC [Christensenellales bacterium]
MEASNTEKKQKGFVSQLKKAFDRYLVKAMSGMALGLFASVIVGVIISQVSKIPGLSLLGDFAAVVGAASPVVGAAIGAGVAHALKHKPLVIFSAIACGAYGYSLGGPLGAYFAAVVGAEIGGLIAGRTRLDIVLVPFVTIIPGCLVGYLVGPGVQAIMLGLGNFINAATMLQPLPMGIVLSVVMGLVLVSPLSSAALAITLGLSGLAAGAATVGCCVQMVGFGVASFRENKWDGLLGQGLGSAKLQLPNAIRRPAILLPTTITSAILGALSTMVFGMQNVAQGAGMGSSGLVGQFTTYAAMSEFMPGGQILLYMLLLHFLLPAVLCFVLSELCRKWGLIRFGDMTLKLN